MPLQHRIYRVNKFPTTRRNVDFISYVDFLVITDFINPTLSLHATKNYKQLERKHSF